MSVYQILLFATLRDLAQTERVRLELPQPATVGTLRRALAQRFPSLAPYTESAIVAVNHTFTTDDTPIAPNDEIAVFPPVSGG